MPRLRSSRRKGPRQNQRCRRARQLRGPQVHLRRRQHQRHPGLQRRQFLRDQRLFRHRRVRRRRVRRLLRHPRRRHLQHQLQQRIRLLRHRQLRGRPRRLAGRQPHRRGQRRQDLVPACLCANSQLASLVHRQGNVPLDNVQPPQVRGRTRRAKGHLVRKVSQERKAKGHHSVRARGKDNISSAPAVGSRDFVREQQALRDPGAHRAPVDRLHDSRNGRVVADPAAQGKLL